MALYRNQLPDSEPDFYSPPRAGSKDVGKYAFDLFLIGKLDKERRELPDKWELNHKLWRGEPWERGKKDKYGLVTINRVYSRIKRRVAQLTDNHPISDVLNIDEGKQQADKARVLNRANSYWWECTEQQELLTLTATQMEVYGVTIEKMVFDPDLNDGIGEVKTIVCDPYTIFFPPGFRSIADMPWLIHAYPEQITKLEKLFPKFKGQIKCEEWIDEQMAEDRETVHGGRTLQTTSMDQLPTAYRNYTSAGTEEGRKGERAMVIELWIRDDSTVKETVMQPVPMGVDPTTGQPIMFPVETVVEKPKYRGGIRCITVTNDGDLVLSDRSNPSINPNLPDELASQTWLWSRFPFEKACANDDPISPWGFSTIEAVEDLIRDRNNQATQISNYLRRLVKPPLVAPRDMGIPTSHITNINGLLLRPTRSVNSQYLRFLDVPNLPGDYWQYLTQIENYDNDAWGSYDVDSGRAPGSMTAASGLMLLDERAQTTVRQEIRAIEKLVRFRGLCWLSHAQNWYTEERFVLAKTAGGKFERMTFKGSDMIGKYDYRVVANSMLPVSSSARSQQAVQFYQLGLVDDQDVLEKTNWPGRDEMMGRKAQAQQAGQQMQQQMMAIETKFKEMELALKAKAIEVDLIKATITSRGKAEELQAQIQDREADMAKSLLEYVNQERQTDADVSVQMSQPTAQ